VVLWAQKWQMEFHVIKCKVLHVGRQNVITIHGSNQVSARNIREILRSLDFG